MTERSISFKELFELDDLRFLEAFKTNEKVFRIYEEKKRFRKEAICMYERLLSCYLNFREFIEFKTILQKCRNLSPKITKLEIEYLLFRGLSDEAEEVLKRLGNNGKYQEIVSIMKKQMEGIFDFSLFSRKGTESTRNLPVFDYQSRRIRLTPIEGKGLGYKSTEGFQAGEIVMFERSLLCERITKNDDRYSIGRIRRILKQCPSLNQRISKLYGGDGNTVDNIERIIDKNSIKNDNEPLFFLRFEFPRKEEEEKKELLLFEKISRFNHSCFPNCCCITSGRIGVVIACQMIEPDTELCINYYTNLRSKRKEKIKSLFGSDEYNCECLECHRGEALDEEWSRRSEEFINKCKISASKGAKVLESYLVDFLRSSSDEEGWDWGYTFEGCRRIVFNYVSAIYSRKSPIMKEKDHSRSTFICRKKFWEVLMAMHCEARFENFVAFFKRLYFSLHGLDLVLLWNDMISNKKILWTLFSRFFGKLEESKNAFEMWTRNIEETFFDKKTKVMMKCEVCGKNDGALKQCSNCKRVYYCSRDHQVKHWKVHKKTCKKKKKK